MTYKIEGQILGRIIHAKVDCLRDLLYAASRAPSSHLLVDGRVLDQGALDLAVASGDREPTSEELEFALF